MNKKLKIFLIFIIIIVLYLLFWPVPIDPVSWEAPRGPGLTGKFSPNNKLTNLELLSIGKNHGPEDVALDAKGLIYASSHGGWIIRLQADGSKPENWAYTGGRPLGIDFDNNENLIVADAFKGLLMISPQGKVSLLSNEADGKPILYADDVDVARDGKIYFSDASTKFGAKECGGTLEASLIDGMEHGGHGRLLVYDPSTGKTATLLDKIDFANGVAVSPDQTFVLVNETFTYRVIKYWIEGPKKGKSEIIIDNLPGFPDNITAGLNGKFWIAFASPRNPMLDSMSDKPFLRKVSQRLPSFIRPSAKAYGFIIAIDSKGKVLENLQDPEGSYPFNTAITETKDYLYIGSLLAKKLGRLPKSKAGL